ncbi:hypothetical protein GGI11_005457 [Coemansia sp. RSA 2049]|nr:hypothetical protein GGI11_005457 [Coemansia sp. RSA 2049]KAJ2613966.1 hypothetical protein EV177_002287 [Coemansia sp. RSA 1804]KAJ2647757.1 hypothetical protein GGH99_007935 [Coemansia sp. RSA 1285]
MASYHTELGLKEEDSGRSSRAAGPSGRLGGGRWVNQAVDDFMTMESNRPTPVSAMAAPERFLSVARMYSDFVEERGADSAASTSSHQQFLESLIMQLYEEANAASTGPPPASREFIRTLPVVSRSQCQGGASVSCTICNEEAFPDSGREQAKPASEDSVTRLPCKHYYHRECVKPWLELHNTCPMCRFEVPSDDPQWLEKKREDEQRSAAEIKDMMMFG